MKKVTFSLLLVIFCSLSIFSAAQGKDVTRFRGTMISPQVQAGDLQTLGGTWNANLIRWQLNWGSQCTLSSPTPGEYDIWLESALKRLDELLPVCESAGLKVLIDLHTTPGGKNEQCELRIFTEQQYQDQFLQVWNKIALRYSNNKTVWGYDLANEPLQGATPAGLMNWYQLATRTAQNIRLIDNSHTIVVEPDKLGNPPGFIGFSPLPSSVSNIIYSVHMYSPLKFTHQGVYYPLAPRYPGIVDGKMYDKAQLKLELKPVIDFQNQYGVRILVGEFSAIRWAPAGSAYNYLKDVIDIFEENGWDWTYHAFREWNGWSVEHTEDKNNTSPAAEQPNREKLLRTWFGKNLKY